MIRSEENAACACPNSPLLEIEDAQFAYPTGKEVLKGISLSVEQGSCLCLMGVNGCGKSTLINCILGENRLSQGTITLSGKNAAAMKPSERARLVCYVPQVHESTFPYLVEHVVAMGRTAYAEGLAGPGSARDKELTACVLSECGISHLAQRPYTALSGGEMQMVMLARALVQDSALIVMDEPTAHLDFRNELLFLETIERLVLQKGKTVLMATHSPNQAFHLERAGLNVSVALLHQGRILHQGVPSAVLNQQALRRVFGVEGIVACIDIPAQGGDAHPRSAHQIVPLKTLKEGFANEPQSGKTLQ